MNLRVLVGTLAGAATLFVLGYLLFGILLPAFMAENTHQYAGLVKEMPDLFVTFLSNVVMAWLLAIVLEYWTATPTFLEGLKRGAVIGLLVALAIDLGELGYMNLYKGYALIPVDVLAETLRWALAGGVIAVVLGLMPKRAKA